MIIADICHLLEYNYLDILLVQFNLSYNYFDPTWNIISQINFTKYYMFQTIL